MEIDQAQPRFKNPDVAGAISDAVAQTITFDAAVELVEVRMNVRCSIRDQTPMAWVEGVAENGMPSGVRLRTATWVQQRRPTEDGAVAFNALVLDSPLAVSAGTRISIVLLGPPGGGCTVSVNDSVVYPGGVFSFAAPSEGGRWVLQVGSIPFETLVER